MVNILYRELSLSLKICSSKMSQILDSLMALKYSAELFCDTWYALRFPKLHDTNQTPQLLEKIFGAWCAQSATQAVLN